MKLNKRLTIVIFQDYLRSGGTEQQSLLFAKVLKSIGHDVLIITCRPNGVLYAKVKKYLLTTYSLQKWDIKLDYFAPNLKKLLQYIYPNIVICMGKVANAKIKNIKLWVPSVFIVGTLRTGKKWSSFIINELNKLPLLLSNSLATKKEWINRSLLMFNKKIENIKVIRNAIVHIFFKNNYCKNSYMLLTTKNKESTLFIFLCIAAFRKNKGQKLLVIIFNILLQKFYINKHIELWLIGDGPYIDTLKKIVKLLNINLHIKILGRINNPYIFYKLTNASLLVSKEESLPNFLVESQSMGIPIIAWDIMGVYECFNKNKSGLLVKNINEFIKYLILFISYKNLQSKMSIYALKYFNEHFNIKKIKNEIINTVLQEYKKFIKIENSKKIKNCYYQLNKNHNNQNIIISRTDALGDLLVSSVLFSEIKKKYINAKIILLLNRNFVDLFKNNKSISQIWKYMDNNISYVLRNMQKININMIIHFYFNYIIFSLSFISNINYHLLDNGIIHSKYLQDPAKSIKKSRLMCKMHEWEYVFQIYTYLHIKKPKIIDYSITPKNLNYNLLSNLAYKVIKYNFIIFHLTASKKKPTISPLFMVYMIKNLKQYFKNIKILIVGNEYRHCSVLLFFKICYLLNIEIENFINYFSLSELSWIIKEAKIVIGRDSGISHLGGINNIPVFCIMGSTIEGRNYKRFHVLGNKSYIYENIVSKKYFDTTNVLGSRSFAFLNINDLICLLFNFIKKNKILVENNY